MFKPTTDMARRSGVLIIYPWMLDSDRTKGLALSGAELLVYAKIYGFTQDGVSVFAGGAQHLADNLHMSRRNVDRALKKLQGEGLIEYLEDGKVVEQGSSSTLAFRCVVDGSPVVQPEPMPEEVAAVLQDAAPAAATSSSSAPKKRSTFRRPTAEEVAAYAKERGDEWLNADEFLDYYDRVGWRYKGQPIKDWKACVRTWESFRRKRAAEDKPAAKRLQRADMPVNQAPVRINW